MREDWVECTFEELVYYSKGKKPKNLYKESADNRLPYINIKAFEKNIIEEYSDDSNVNFCENGNILMVWDGARAGFSGKSSKGIVGSTLMKILPTIGVTNNYLYYFLQSLYKFLNTNTKGVGIPHVEPILLWKKKVGLPPLPEQRAIVKKIEALFSSLDAGIADLKKAQDQLKIYRQAVLKKAFEGIRNEKTLEEIKNDSMIGLVKSNAEQFEVGETPYIKMNNITMDGKTDIANTVFVKVTDFEKDKYNLLKGDLLINTRNSFELVGKTGIIREDLPGYVFNNNLMRLRVNKDVNPLFIFYQLIGPKLRKDMIAEKKATTSICALYQRDLFPLKVKVISSLEEQAQIVKEIESRLSVCDAVEQQIKDSLSQAEALRQSILKKAFEGKLLTEEEIKACQLEADYEPAAVLLEKIKAEKEANKPVKKTKKKVRV